MHSIPHNPLAVDTARPKTYTSTPTCPNRPRVHCDRRSLMSLNRHASPSRRVWPQVEQLEAREAVAGFQPTAVEQLFLERLNDARANPAAFGAAIGHAADPQLDQFYRTVVPDAYLSSQNLDL